MTPVPALNQQPATLLHSWRHDGHHAVIEECVPGFLGLPDIEDPEDTGLRRPDGFAGSAKITVGFAPAVRLLS